MVYDPAEARPSGTEICHPCNTSTVCNQWKPNADREDRTPDLGLTSQQGLAELPFILQASASPVSPDPKPQAPPDAPPRHLPRVEVGGGHFSAVLPFVPEARASPVVEHSVLGVGGVAVGGKAVIEGWV